MSNIFQAVRAVESIAEDKSWIPVELRGKLTFFSDYDLWEYHYVHDDRVCHVCEGHGDMSVIIGSKIRLLFPYMEIMDEDLIEVNEHLNCRCTLTRIGFFEKIL